MVLIKVHTFVFSFTKIIILLYSILPILKGYGPVHRTNRQNGMERIKNVLTNVLNQTENQSWHQLVTKGMVLPNVTSRLCIYQNMQNFVTLAWAEASLSLPPITTCVYTTNSSVFHVASLTSTDKKNHVHIIFRMSPRCV